MARRKQKTIFNVPAWGFFSGLLLTGLMMAAALTVVNWLAENDAEHEVVRLQTATDHARELLERELLLHEELMVTISRAWASLQRDRQVNLNAFLGSLERHTDTVEHAHMERIFIYDVMNPNNSRQILPVEVIPLPREARDVELFARELTSEKYPPTSIEKVHWLYPESGDGENVSALMAAPFGEELIIISEYNLSEALDIIERNLVQDDNSIAIDFTFGTQSSASVSAADENPELFRYTQPIYIGDRPTPYRVMATSRTPQSLTLQSALQRVVLAGGIIGALAMGALLMGWSRSTMRFSSAKARQRLLRDRSPLFYQDMDQDLRITDVNLTQIKALGYTAEEMIGMSFKDLIVGSPEMERAFERGSDEGTPITLEGTYRTKIGVDLEVIITAIRYFDDDGNRLWALLAQDVTEEKQFRRASQRSRLQVRFLSQVVENLGEGLLVMDQQSRVLYANPAGIQLTDPDFRGILGRAFGEVFELGDQELQVWNELVGASDRNEPWSRKLRVRGMGDVQVSVSLAGMSSRESGEGAIILLVRDTTREMLLNRELAASEKKYMMIFSQAPSGIVVLDKQGFIIDSNNAYREYIAPHIDWPKEGAQQPLIGHVCFRRVGVRQNVEQLFEGKEVNFDPLQLPSVTPGEEARVLSIKGIPELSHQGELLRVFFFVDDITQRYQVELLQRERALSLEGEKEEAIKESQLKSQFMATITHELRTPLNAIIGFSQILLRARNSSTFDDRQRGNLERIELSGKQLLRLVNDLLDFSKIEAGHIEVNYEKINVSLFFDSMQEMVVPLAEKRNNEMHFEIDDEVDIVEADPMRLRQILINLIGNAAKFTENGKITVHVSLDFDEGSNLDCFKVDVIDTGVGIPEDKVAAVFGEFYQVEAGSARSYEGSGLGLTISKRLAELMHGDITVVSEEGTGSTFTLRLPRERYVPPPEPEEEEEKYTTGRFTSVEIYRELRKEKK